MSNVVYTCLLCQPGEDKKERTEVSKLKCGHIFCWLCLNKYVSKNMSVHISCPSFNCRTLLQDRLVRKILSKDDIPKYDQICLNNVLISAHVPLHRCLSEDCWRIIQYSDYDVSYTCVLCGIFNCIKCNKPHKSMSCAQFMTMRAKDSLELCQSEKERAKRRLERKLAANRRASIVDGTNHDLIKNAEPFKCLICELVVAKGKGVQLRDCFHLFCRPCLCDHITQDPNLPSTCPHNHCTSLISSREYTKLLDKDQLVVYNNKLLVAMKPKLSNVHQCQQPNCTYFCEVNGYLSSWKCPKCKKMNCVSCKTIHENGICRANIDPNAQNKIEERFIEERIKKKELMRCPDCKKLLEKTRGCNFIKCACGQELCWIRQMYRWGPKGRYDTSGGCRCGVDGKNCHKDCSSGCTPH